MQHVSKFLKLVPIWQSYNKTGIFETRSVQ